MYIIIYTFTLYYILNIISINKNKKYEKQINYFENNNYKINNKDNIIIIFLEKIFGNKEHNNYQNITYNKEEKKIDIKNLYRKNISGLIFIFVIFLLSLSVVYFIIYYYYNNDKNINIFLNNIKIFIIIPILSITIILFILNSTLQYNTIYNNLIKEVNNKYLNDLSEPNQELIKYLKDNKSYKIVNNLKLVFYHAIYFNLFKSSTKLLINDIGDITLLINEKNDVSNIESSKKFNFEENNICNIYNIKFLIKDTLFRDYNNNECKNGIKSFTIKYKNLKEVCNNIKIDINENQKNIILSKYKNMDTNKENIDDITKYMYHNVFSKKIKNEVYDKINNLEKYIYKTLNYIYHSEFSANLNSYFYDAIIFSADSKTIDDDNIKISEYNCLNHDINIVKNQLNNIIKTIKYEYKNLIVKNLLLKVLAENKITNEYNKIFKNKNKNDNIDFYQLLYIKSGDGSISANNLYLYDMEFNNKIINEYEIDLFNIIKDFFENIHEIIKIKIKTKEEENLYNNYKIINGDNSIHFEKLIEKKDSKIETISNIKFEKDLNLANYLIYILLFVYILILLIIKYIN